MERNFVNMLQTQWALGKFVSVGLDSERDKIPAASSSLSVSHQSVLFDFNEKIIEATKGIACVYKINLAFYIASGEFGLSALQMTVKFILENAPQVPIILDGKFGDIGNSSRGYATFVFDFLCADAVTVNPYLGLDSLEPFLERKDKGVFVLCRTSNRGAEDFQTIKTMPDGKPFYLRLASKICEWSANGNCGIVAGATAPDDIRNIRGIACEIPMLIPGIGAQMGDLEKSVKAACCCHGKCKAIINSSRGIIFASSRLDFAERAGEEAEKLNNQIRGILNWKGEKDGKE